MKTQKLFLLVVLLFGIMVCSSCEKSSDGEEIHAGESRIYGFEINKVSDFDYMIVNAENNNSVFYNVETSSPSELYFKPYANDTYGYTMKFGSDGLPDLLIIGDTIVAFENYRGTKVDIAVIYPNITVKYHYGIDIGISADELQLRSTRSILKFVSMGLSVASIVAAVVVPTPASPFIIMAAASSLAISSWSVGNYFFEETIPAVPSSVEIFGSVLGCASSGWGCYTGALSATASVMADNLDYADSREPLINTVKAEMRDNGNSNNGNNNGNNGNNNNNNENGNNSEIIDKTLQINLTSTMGLGNETYSCVLKSNGVMQIDGWRAGSWSKTGNTLIISWKLEIATNCTYRFTGALNGNQYTGTYTHYDSYDGKTELYDRGTFSGTMQ